MRIKNALDDVAFMNALFTRSEVEAHRLGDDIPGAEHFLLAALVMDDESGRNALRAAGHDADEFREAVASAHAEALRAVGVTAHDAAPIGGRKHSTFRSSPAAQEVFHRAVAISKSRAPHRLRTADVVRAVAELEGGTAARAITSLGIDRGSLVAATTSAVTDS